MPTYDYTCDSCGHEFERQQRITEDPVKKCPKCGKLEARRMIGGGGFILRGGGWESDLYSGPSNRAKSSNAEASGASTSGSSESSSSDSSPKSSPDTASKSSATSSKSSD